MIMIMIMIMITTIIIIIIAIKSKCPYGWGWRGFSGKYLKSQVARCNLMFKLILSLPTTDLVGFCLEKFKNIKNHKSLKSCIRLGLGLGLENDMYNCRSGKEQD